MRHNYIFHSLNALAVLLGILIFSPAEASAHCDTMDGPVVKAAQKALAKRNVNLVAAIVYPIPCLAPSISKEMRRNCVASFTSL